MDDKQAMHAMSIDDAYHVERTLARGPSGVTELVSIDGNGPFVRKKMRYPPRHHAGQRHRGPGWRASHRFRHCAHMVSVKQSLAGHHGAWHLWFRLARAIWLRQNRRAFRRVLAWSTARIHADRRISRCQRLRAATCR